MTLAITGPTGHIGSRLVQRLLDADADLTLLLRNPDKLDITTRGRVKTQQGELQDPAFVRRATQGATALFWLTPADPKTSDLQAWYDHLGSNAAMAVRANDIPYVVNISSAGAQLPNAGPVSGLGRIERHLNATNANIVHLRPGYFMENTLMQLDAIRNQNSLFAPGSGDIPFPQIATRDIADVAARLLHDPNWKGQRIQGLHGPADLTFNQTAAILSEVLGRPIRYVEVTPEQTRQALLGIGFGPAFIDAYLEMMAALAQPGAIAEPRTPETTTPTRLAQWAKDTLVPMLNG